MIPSYLYKSECIWYSKNWTIWEESTLNTSHGYLVKTKRNTVFLISLKDHGRKNTFGKLTESLCQKETEETFH